MASRGAEVNPIEVRLFRVFGLWCPSCARSCERSLKKNPGVHEAQIDFASGQLKLAFDSMRLSMVDIRRLVRRLGFSLIEDERDARGSQIQVEAMYLVSLAVAWFFGMWVTLLQLWTYLQKSPFEAEIHTISALLTSLVLSFGAWPFWKASWHGLRSWTLNLDIVVLLGNLSLYAASLSQLLQSGNAVFFDSIVMSISTILTLRWLDYRLRTRTGEGRELRSFLERRTEVRVFDEGEELLATVAQVARGREILLTAGESLAFDGTLEEGELWIDSSLLSGESQVRLYRAGSELLAGMEIREGRGRLRVERVVGERWIDQQLFQTESSSTARASQKQRLERIYRYWLPTLLISACLGALFFGGSGLERLERFALVLLVGCPCLLLMAPTLLRLRLLRELSALGISLRHPDILERASGIRTLIFDKTGTLTRPGSLRTFYQAPPAAEAQADQDVLLKEVRRLLSYIDHPLRLLASPPGVNGTEVHLKTHPGQGSILRFPGQAPIFLGRATFVAQQLGKPLPEGLEPRGLFWGQGEDWVAAFHWDEELESGCESMLRRLRDASSRLLLASGDRTPLEPPSWLRYFEAAHFELLPEGKVALLDRWRAQGPIAFIGDGMNDRLVMSRADLSVAVFRPEQSPPLGAMLRLPAAELTRFPELLARLRFFGSLQNGLWIAALSYNAAMILAAWSGLLSPGLAVALFAVVSSATLCLAHFVGRPVPAARPSSVES